MPMQSRALLLVLAGTAVIGCIGLTPAIARAETWEDEGAQVEAEADDWGPADEEAYVGEEGADDGSSGEEGTGEEGTGDAYEHAQGSDDGSVPDLDAYAEAQLDAELEDELDDIYQAHEIDPYAEYDIDTLRGWILECLMDDRDDNPEVTYANLQAEMAEAGTTLEDAIDEGLAEADLLSSTTRLPTRPAPGHAITYGLTASGVDAVGMESRANRMAQAGNAVTRVKFSISRSVLRGR